MAQTEFLKSFEIAIQTGAILAAVAYYWRSLVLDRQTFLRVLVAFIPTMFIGLLLYRFVKAYLLEDVRIVLLSLLLGGIAIVGFEYWHKKRAIVTTSNRVTYSQAILIGVAQSLALIPGVSRSAATIIGGLGMGLDRKTIVDFSFLLAIPTMLAATALDLYQSADQFTADEFAYLGIGSVAAFCVALASIVLLLKFIRHHSFSAFGYYRIVLASIFWLFLV